MLGVRKIIEKAKLFLLNGHERTVAVKKNILISIILRGCGIGISLVLVPITINYLNPVNYGIWLTLNSIISWFSFFDVGLGNGLKNKIAESNALGDLRSSNVYVSTTYAVIAIISVLMFLVFCLINSFVSWSKILNIGNLQEDNLNVIALFIFGFFCLQFVLQILNTVLIGNHAISKVSLISVVGQAISFLFMCILTTKTKGSLLLVVIILAGVPTIVIFFASVWYYKKDYKSFSPNIRNVNFKHAKDLLNVGSLFFFIQLGGLILFQTDNIIITQLFGPIKVTEFNLSYKLFSTIIMFFSIFMSPFWSSFTDAYSKKDFEWIKNIFKKIYRYFFIVVICTFILLALSPYIYKLWIGKSAGVSFAVSFAIATYTIGFCWLLIHCSLLNGISKIKVQLYLYIVSTIVNIPLALFLGKIFGVAGVTFSNNIILVIMGIVLYVQCRKIINNDAKGIWNA